MAVEPLREWWFWRLKPAPLKRLESLRLPWRYTGRYDDEITIAQLEATKKQRQSSLDIPVKFWRRAQPTSTTKSVGSPAPPEDAWSEQSAIGAPRGNLTRGIRIVEATLERMEMPTSGQIRERWLGSMRTMEIDVLVPNKPGARRWTRRTWWITPPMEQFCDLSKHFGVDTWKAYGPPRFWLNRDVYEATTEFMQGDLIDELQRSTHMMKEVSMLPTEVGQFVMVALDSYLERGVADPRFNPSRGQQHSHRR